MSIETIAATRIYNGGEESYLSWEKFPYVGLLKVHKPVLCVDTEYPDTTRTLYIHSHIVKEKLMVKLLHSIGFISLNQEMQLYKFQNRDIT